MHCKQVMDWLPAFAADRLPPDVAVTLEEHLAGCDNCWAAWERECEAASGKVEGLGDLEGALTDSKLVHLMVESPPPLPKGWTEALLGQIDWPKAAKTRWWATALRHPAVSITYAAAAVLLVFSVAQRVFLWDSATNGFGSILLQGQLWLVQISARLSGVSAWASSLWTYFF
jgi:hypothetical protein